MHFITKLISLNEDNFVCTNDMIILRHNRYIRFLSRSVIKGSLLVTGIISLTSNCTIAQAQSNQLDSANKAPSSQSNNIAPVRQQNFYPNSQGSQDFFRQDNDRLYFLPEKKSEPILEIDETVEAEEIDNEDLQEKSLDE